MMPNFNKSIPSSKIIEEKRKIDEIIRLMRKLDKPLSEVFELRLSARDKQINQYKTTKELPLKIEYLKNILDTDIILFCIIKATIEKTKLMEEWSPFPNDSGIIYQEYKQKRFHPLSGARDVLDSYFQKVVEIIENNKYKLKAISESYSLSQAYPNPFNPTTTLNFAIPVDNEVILSIYNLQGREVATLINGNVKAGYHSVVWDANSYASGVYFVKMMAGEYISTQKLMLIK